MLAEILAAALVGLTAPSSPTPVPCKVQQVSARCASVTVPEDRSRPGARRIRLRVVVLPARIQPAPAHAFAYLAGGPGSAAASGMTASVASTWAGVNERMDILLIDQRGTGASNPLSCPPPKGVEASAGLRASIATCLARLPGDPRHYGTTEAADDLEDVRRALGYEQLDVYGTSYGATLAQVFLNRHPGSVRTMVLDGATFLDVSFFGRFAANGHGALGKIADRCAADPRCAASFPTWRRTLPALVARWNASPVTLSDGSRITGDGLASVIQTMSLDAGKARWIPLAVTSAARGDLTTLSSFLDPGGVSTSIMYWSIMCNEPWVGLDARGPFHTYLDGTTASRLAGMRTICSSLPRRAAQKGDWRRPRGAIPVLALTGEADPQDPAGNIAGLGSAFPDSRLVVAPGQGHAVGQLGCLPALTARFVVAGTTRGLDVRCAERISAPAFALP